MGMLLFNQSKLDQAESLFTEVLAKQRQVLGTMHPDTLSTMTRLGDLKFRQGKLDAA